MPSIGIADHRRVESSRDSVRIALVADETDGFAYGADPPGERIKTSVPASSAVGVRGGDFADDVADVVVEAGEFFDLKKEACVSYV